MRTLRLTNGRVIDPSQGVDQVTDLWIRGETVLGIGPHAMPADQTIDCTGKIVCPGLIDMHVHLREPGREEDETVATGTAAALAGGVTSVVCMPNTEPPLATAETIAFVIQKAREAGNANVFPLGAITRDRHGAEVADLEAMAAAGAVGFTDDGSPVVDSGVMRRAMERCR